MQGINLSSYGYSSRYTIYEDGSIYDSMKKKYVKLLTQNRYHLHLDDEYTYKLIQLNKLYKEVYNKYYCIDNIKDLEGEEWLPANEEINKDSIKSYWISSKGRIKSYKGYNARILS